MVMSVTSFDNRCVFTQDCGLGIGRYLRVSASINALDKAIQQAVSMTDCEDLSGLIHHSDRGVQYCCDKYVNALNNNKIAISMTEDYNPTDNAIAERINGIIKTELVYQLR